MTNQKKTPKTRKTVRRKTSDPVARQTNHLTASVTSTASAAIPLPPQICIALLAAVPPRHRGMLCLTAGRFRQAQLDAVEHGVVADVSNKARSRATRDPLTQWTVQNGGGELFKLLKVWQEDTDTALRVLEHLYAYTGSQLLLYDSVRNSSHPEWVLLLLQILTYYHNGPVIQSLQRSVEDIYLTCTRVPLDRIHAPEMKVVFVCICVLACVVRQCDTAAELLREQVAAMEKSRCYEERSLGCGIATVIQQEYGIPCPGVPH